MADDLRNAFRKFKRGVEPRREVLSGWLVDANDPRTGDARVADEPGKLFVMLDRGEGATTGDIVKAFGRIRPVPGWPVRIGTTRERPWEYSILDVDGEAMGGAIDGEPIIEPHAQTHEWGNPSGGDDAVYPRFIQLADFSVGEGIGLRPIVGAGHFRPSGIYSLDELNETYLDGVEDWQPSWGQRYVLVCLSPTGTFEYVPGPVKYFLTLDDVPQAPSQLHWELAAVRIRSIDSNISNSPDDVNILDLRFARLGWPVTLDDGLEDNLLDLQSGKLSLPPSPSGTFFAGGPEPAYRPIEIWDLPPTGTPGLPAGAANQMLRHNGSEWVPTSSIQNDDTDTTLAGDLDMASGKKATIEEIRAVDGDGLILLDDAGNYGIKICDGGQVVVGNAGPAEAWFHVISEDSNAPTRTHRCYDGPGGAAESYYKSRGSFSSPAVVQVDDVVGGYNAYAYDGSSYDLVGRVRHIVSAVAAGDVQSYIEMTVSDASGVEKDVVRITDSGVGIGTTSPDYELDVDGDVGVNEYIYHNDDDDTYIRYQDDQITLTAGGVILIDIMEGAVDYVRFPTYVGINVAPGGNVNLDVDGDVRVQNGLIIGGTNETSANPGEIRFDSQASVNAGASYLAQESSSYANRYWIRFDTTDDASYPYLTNRTPGGDVAIFTGTAAGGGENEHFRVEGGDGTVNAYFTNADVGIGTTSPNVQFDNTGGSAFRESTVSLAGGGDDVSIGNTTTVYLTATANADLTGIAGGADGRVVILINGSSYNVTLKDEDANSSAANRLAMQNDSVLEPDEAAILVYSDTDSRWHLCKNT